MSEYQYYEFQAMDRPLGEADRQALRDLSTRGRITATSFTNSYEWGNFKGDPAKLMDRWFDLHLYLANWGSRRLMIRLPKRLVDRRRFDAFLGEADCVALRDFGYYSDFDINRDQLEFEDWDDGSGWLAALTPLRAEVIEGDLRLFYLIWLMAVEADLIDANAMEPMPGIGPMTAALEAFAAFFGIDPDLVEAAAERPAVALSSATPSDAALRIISAMTDPEKTGLLARLYDGDPHIAAELRATVRGRMATDTAVPPVAARTVGDLRARAIAIGLAHQQAAAEKLAAEQRRRAEEVEKTRQTRLAALARRGESVWQEVASEIERRTAKSYDKVTSLLVDLRAIAEERGAVPDFEERLRVIRERHAKKQRFIERLAEI